MIACSETNSQVSSKQTPESIVQKFFEHHQTGGFSSGLDHLSNFIDWDNETIEKLKAGALKNQALLGDYLGNSFLVKNEVEDRLKIIIHMARYENAPMKYIFIFYRPDKDWKLHQFKYNDNIVAELEEVTNTYPYFDLIKDKDK